jgi:hypothetical protein
MADYSEYFRGHWPELQQAPVYSPRPNPTFRNPEFASASARILVSRLSPLRDVDRSSPHLVLAQLARRALPEAYIDMHFFPPRHDRERFKRDGMPLLVGSQSARSADEFDLVLVSNSYLLELINLPLLLLGSGVPLWSSQRGEEMPAFVLGGSNATASQAVVSEDGDCLADAIFFGEAEEQLVPLLQAFASRRGLPKRQRLKAAAAAAPALWVAGDGFGHRVEPAIVHSPTAQHLPTDYPSLNGPEAGTARLQISYGCPAFCGFCYEGYDRKPYREVRHGDVIAAAVALKAAQGCDAVELHAYNFNTHTSVLALLHDLNRLFARVGFTSQRVDLLAAMPGLLEAEVAAGKRTFTFGIEGISERQRAFLHKSLTAAQTRSVLTATLDHHPRQVKLFYLFTGHEDERDLAEFRDFVGWLKPMRSRLSRAPRVTFSFGWLIRMPFTPLRYDRLFLDEEGWKGIVGPVKSVCETNGFEFRLAMQWDEYCTSQVLAIGGHWLAKGIAALAREGHCYDRGLTPGYWERVKAWMSQAGHWTDQLFGEKGAEYPFPMRFLAPPVDAGFLFRQYRQALACQDPGYCLGSATQGGRCMACGACRDEEQRQRIVGHGSAGPAKAISPESLAVLMQEKRALRPVYVRVWVPPSLSNATRQWLDAACLRAILRSHPSLVETLFGAQEALFSVGANSDRYPVYGGETVYALRTWDTAALRSELFPSGPPAREALAAAMSARTAGPERRGEEREEAPGRLAILGPAIGFEPGRFSQATLTLRLPTRHFPQPADRLVRFLRSVYVPCNVRRVGAGRVLDLPARALKKRHVLGGQIEDEGGSTLVRLVVGPKFDLEAFLKSFGGRARYRHAQVAVSDLVW